MKLNKIIIYIIVTSLAQVLIAQDFETPYQAETYSRELKLLKQNDFKSFETAIINSDAEVIKKYLSCQIDTNSILSFLKILPISSKSALFSHHKSDHSIWSSTKKKYEQNIIELETKSNKLIELEYTYSISDSIINIYTLSYKDSEGEIHSIPHIYGEYLTLKKENRNLESIENLTEYEKKTYDTYYKCEKSQIPFIDSLKATNDILTNYSSKILHLILDSKDLPLAEKISKRGSELDPKHSRFLIYWVISKSLLETCDSTKEALVQLKQMPSSISIFENGYEELLFEIKRYQKHELKCQCFDKIKSF